MLLEPEEISVEGGEYQFHDYCCMGVRLDLYCIGSAPDLPRSAVVTLSNPVLSVASQIKVGTNVFSLADVPEHSETFQVWEKWNRSGKYEQSYHHFLLERLRTKPGVKLTFLVSDDRVYGVRIDLGSVKLQGRFEDGLNILETHFSVRDSVAD
jgi:hypothetical protein